MAEARRPPALTIEELRVAVADGAIDTVLVALPDMVGRLVGKRADAEYFLSHLEHGIDHCNSLLALDMESDTTPGYAIANIDDGYGDFVLQPDIRSLRRLPWHDRTALAICDPRRHDGAVLEPCPRTMLHRQVERARALGYEPVFACEVEFLVCRETYEEAWRSSYDDLTLGGRYNTDSHLLAAGFEERLIGDLRRQLKGAGVPVVASKAEAWPGQHELVFAHGDPVAICDDTVVFKHGAKEIAERHGCSITFMAKARHDWIGSSCHVHMSLYREGVNLFVDESTLFARYLAGQLAHARELAVFLAPTVNSYKRFVADSWAGTSLTWARDNRTCGFRAVGRGSSSRVEARIPGADANPYLACAALLAAGLDGIERELELPPPVEGNVYEQDVPRFPATLREAVRALEQGTFARGALGDSAVDHYLNFARWEQRYFDRVVTDYERARMFEQA